MAQATTVSRTSGKRARQAALEGVRAGLSTIAQAVNQVRLHDRLLQRAGIRLDRASASLLTKLQAEDGPLRVTDLAERLCVDPPTVTRKVQQLERLGLVERLPDADDRRSQRILLTDEGRSTMLRVQAVRHEWIDSLLEGWSDEDRTTFSALLGRFADRLRTELDGARGD